MKVIEYFKFKICPRWKFAQVRGRCQNDRVAANKKKEFYFMVGLSCKLDKVSNPKSRTLVVSIKTTKETYCKGTVVTLDAYIDAFDTRIYRVGGPDQLCYTTFHIRGIVQSINNYLVYIYISNVYFNVPVNDRAFTA